MTLSNARKAAAAASGESKGSGLVSNGLQADGQRRGGGHTTYVDVAKPGLYANNKCLSVTTEDIAQERVALLADRQLQLDQVLDKHDDLVSHWFSFLAIVRGVLTVLSHCPGYRYGRGSISNTS